MDPEVITFLFNLATSIGASFIYDISKNLVKLLPHQESNLTKWKKYWKLTICSPEHTMEQRKLSKGLILQ